MVLGIDVHGEPIVSLVFDYIRNIRLEARITAEIARDEASVEIHGRVGGNALKVYYDSLVPECGIEGEFLSVPGVLVLEKAERIVILLRSLLQNDVVVGQADLLPALGLVLVVIIRVVGHRDIVLGGRAPLHSLGLGLDIDRPLHGRGLGLDVSSVKQPPVIEQYLLSHSAPPAQKLLFKLIVAQKHTQHNVSVCFFFVILLDIPSEIAVGIRPQLLYYLGTAHSIKDADTRFPEAGIAESPAIDERILEHTEVLRAGVLTVLTELKGVFLPLVADDMKRHGLGETVGQVDHFVYRVNVCVAVETDADEQDLRTFVI